MKNLRTQFLTASLILLVASCSSTKTTESEISKEFEWIENSDFIEVTEVPFNPASDNFSEEITKIDSLSRESIARIPEAKLEEVEESNDPISKIVALCYQRKFKVALQYFRKEYERYNKNPSFWNQMGTCHLIEGNYRKSLLFYNKSRDLGKKYSPPINNLGVLYLKRGEPQKALAAFEKATDVNRFSVTPLFNLGNLYLRYGLSKKALKVFKTLLTRNSNDLDVVSSLAISYLMSGEPASAVSLFRNLPSDYIENPKVGVNFAVALAMVNRKDEAKDVLSDLNRIKNPRLGAYLRKVRKDLGL